MQWLEFEYDIEWSYVLSYINAVVSGYQCYLLVNIMHSNFCQWLNRLEKQANSCHLLCWTWLHSNKCRYSVFEFKRLCIHIIIIIIAILLPCEIVGDRIISKKFTNSG